MSYVNYVTWWKSEFNYTTPQLCYKQAKAYKAWQIAVAVPISNYRFSYPKKITRYISANCGGNSLLLRDIEIDCGTNEARDQFINLISPNVFGLISKKTTNVGEIFRLTGSYATIDGTTNSYLRLKTRDHIKNLFDTTSNSMVEFICPVLADKWELDHSKLIPINLTKQYVTDYFKEIDGNFSCQRLQINTPQFDATTKTFYTILENLQEYANNSYKYRIGVRYRIRYVPATGAVGTIQVSLLGCTATTKISNLVYSDSTNLYNYYEFQSGVFSDWRDFDTLRRSDYYKMLQIRFIGDASTSSAILYFDIDSIYLEHSAELETLLGAYLFNSKPDRDSLEIITRNEDLTEYLTTNNNDKFITYPFGNPIQATKYGLKCTFSDVSAELLNALRILERFQDNGFLLNLHPQIPELPMVLTGIMKIINVRKSSVDFKRQSFDFEFQEV